MKFTAKTIQVLKNFASINSCIHFKKGNILKTVNQPYTIVGMAKLDQEIEQDFAIFDLNRFLGALSLFNNPDIKLHERYMTITDGSKELNYVFADPATILKPKDGLALPNVATTVKISASTLADILKALSVMGLPELALVGDGESISVQAINSEDPTSDVFKITNLGNTDKVFKAIYKVENLKILPGEYTVDIASKGISLFKGENIEYFVAIEKNSTMS